MNVDCGDTEETEWSWQQIKFTVSMQVRLFISGASVAKTPRWRGKAVGHVLAELGLIC